MPCLSLNFLGLWKTVRQETIDCNTTIDDSSPRILFVDSPSRCCTGFEEAFNRMSSMERAFSNLTLKEKDVDDNVRKRGGLVDVKATTFP